MRRSSAVSHGDERDCTGEQAQPGANRASEREGLLEEPERERGDEGAAREREQYAGYPSRRVPKHPEDRADYEGARGSQSVSTAVNTRTGRTRSASYREQTLPPPEGSGPDDVMGPTRAPTKHSDARLRV
jgi:hypothetical protein